MAAVPYLSALMYCMYRYLGLVKVSKQFSFSSF